MKVIAILERKEMQWNLDHTRGFWLIMAIIAVVFLCWLASWMKKMQGDDLHKKRKEDL